MPPERARQPSADDVRAGHLKASRWHTDLDLSRPIEVMTDMAVSRKRGFLAYQNTEEAFHDLFATLRADKIIP